MTRASAIRRHAARAVISVAASALVLIAGGAKATGTGAADWPAYLKGADHSSYNAAATSITPGNAGALFPAWTWATPASTNAGMNQILASPTVAGGVVYVGAEDGEFYAISEATHAVLWSDFLGIDALDSNGGCAPTGITATATVAADPVTDAQTVYVSSADGNLYALDASTGSVEWASPIDSPSTTIHDYYSWGSPLVANGKVYIGISSACDDPLVRGGVAAFDQHTGASTARWLDTPAGKLGGSVWSSPVLLGDGDIAVTTGNGYVNSGQPLYNESIIRLDPTTLAPLDAWQVPVAQQVQDADFGASPTVWTATINGTSTPMVGACNKNGIFYAFRQADLAAGPVWQTRITVPYPGGAKECISAAVWDGTRLIVGGGAQTTIGNVTYPGSVQALDPATGTPLWQTGLSGTIVGTPTEDGGGVVAAPAYSSTTKPIGVYLLDASTGAQVGFIPVGQQLFGQPVFAGSDLLVAAGGAYGLDDYEVAPTGPPITKVSPSVVAPGTTHVVTLTGSGFSGTPTVVVSGSGVTATSVTLKSSTVLNVKLHLTAGAALGPRNITVFEPGPVADSCTACFTVGTPAPPPAPTAVTPDVFAPGTTTTNVTVTGTNFQSGATVTSAAGIGFPVVTYIGSTQLTVTIRVASTTAAGAYTLYVHNPDGYTGQCTGCVNVS
jgi:outer membrane protein assembly factor BamB